MQNRPHESNRAAQGKSMIARLFVISAPSGAGKTSLVKALRERLPSLRVSTSHTTRPPRPTELDGREYHFVSNQVFDQMVAEGAFLEHARVFGNQYGTSQGQLEDKLAAGHEVILEIDWQGARQVRDALPGCQSIFVLPPSRQALRQRLTGRGTDSGEVIERRLADAVTDMSHHAEFDFVVVNDQFELAVEQLLQIVASRGDSFRAGRPELTPILRNLLDFKTV
jgi:guanylate kinase